MYKVHLLNDREFDALPKDVTRGSRIDDSLGFSDPTTGHAYVRMTVSHDLNKFLVNHELEELQASESFHEDENGIRHKKARDFFSFGASKKERKQENAARDAALAVQQSLAPAPIAAAGPLAAFAGGGGGAQSPATSASPVPGQAAGGGVVGSLNQAGSVSQLGTGGNPVNALRRFGFFQNRIPF